MGGRCSDERLCREAGGVKMWAAAAGQHETGRGRGRVRLLGVAALLLALLAAAAPLPAPARAAPNVRVVATANFGGAFRAGAWVPITVTLANDGTAATGEVVVQTDGGGGGERYFQRVELLTRSQKALVLYVLATDTARNVRVTFTSGNDVVPAPPVGLTLVRPGQPLIGVIGDDARASGEIVRALFGVYGNGVEAIAVAPGDVPDNPYGLGSFAALILTFPNGVGVLIGTILAVAVNDAAALFIGSKFGQRPLAPEVSPGKTVEGVVGGGLAGVVASWLVLGVIGIFPWGTGSAIALGLVVAVAAPLGDLCESMLKRDLGVKDMGTLLPGHGGLLDRFDALLFALPAVYYLCRLLEIF